MSDFICRFQYYKHKWTLFVFIVKKKTRLISLQLWTFLTIPVTKLMTGLVGDFRVLSVSSSYFYSGFCLEKQEVKVWICPKMLHCFLMIWPAWRSSCVHFREVLIYRSGLSGEQWGHFRADVIQVTSHGALWGNANLWVLWGRGGGGGGEGLKSWAQSSKSKRSFSASRKNSFSLHSWCSCVELWSCWRPCPQVRAEVNLCTLTF